MFSRLAKPSSIRITTAPISKPSPLRSFILPTAIRAMSTTIPTTMRGISIDKTGGPEVLQYKTDPLVPEPQAGEILVKNEYIGINFIDTYALQTHHTRTPSQALPLPA